MTTPTFETGRSTSGKPAVGFLSANNRWGTHYDHFMAIVPDGIEVQIKPLETALDGSGQLRRRADLMAMELLLHDVQHRETRRRHRRLGFVQCGVAPSAIIVLDPNKVVPGIAPDLVGYFHASL